MPDLQTTSALVAQMFVDLVKVGPYAALPTQYDNTPAVEETQRNGLWASVAFAPTTARQIEVSPARARRNGFAQVTLYGPSNEGDKKLWDLAKVVEAAYRHKTVDLVTFRTPETVSLGRQGKFWVLAVRCPLVWEE